VTRPRIGRRLAAALAVVLVAGLVALVLVVGGNEGGSTSGADARTTSGAPSSPGVSRPPPSSASSTPEQTDTPDPGPAGSDEPPPLLSPADFDQPVTVEGVDVSIARVERIEGSGVGPGNIAGPAVRVTVRLRNDGAAAVPVDLVAVSLTYGLDATPASPLEDPSVAPFRGTLQAGGTEEGRYVFSVPREAADMEIRVGRHAAAPVAVFIGEVS
jgi:hypothetical protein